MESFESALLECAHSLNETAAFAKQERRSRTFCFDVPMTLRAFARKS